MRRQETCKFICLISLHFCLPTVTYNKAATAKNLQPLLFMQSNFSSAKKLSLYSSLNPNLTFSLIISLFCTDMYFGVKPHLKLMHKQPHPYSYKILSKIAYPTQQKYTHTETDDQTVIYTAEKELGDRLGDWHWSLELIDDLPTGSYIIQDHEKMLFMRWGRRKFVC